MRTRWELHERTRICTRRRSPARARPDKICLFTRASHTTGVIMMATTATATATHWAFFSPRAAFTIVADENSESANPRPKAQPRPGRAGRRRPVLCQQDRPGVQRSTRRTPRNQQWIEHRVVLLRLQSEDDEIRRVTAPTASEVLFRLARLVDRWACSSRLAPGTSACGVRAVNEGGLR